MNTIARDILLLLLTVISSVAGATAKTGDASHVLTRTMLDESGTMYVEKTDYYDGLGRPYLTVDGSADPQGPVASLVEYGSLGEVSRAWLPVPVQPHALPRAATVRDAAVSHYGDDFPYSDITRDALGRETMSLGPGSAWREADRPMSTRHLANGAATVKMYTVDNAGKLRSGGHYPKNSLRLQRVTDEDGHTVEVYTDPVMGKVMERRGADNDTYYVYDSLGRLTFILQPAYQHEPDLSLYAFVYGYDSCGNLVSVTAPGCAPVTYGYDRGRRIALTHTPSLSGKGRARFHLYDPLGREVVTGTCCDTDIPAHYTATTAYTGSGTSAALGGYSLPSGVVLADILIETVRYYDRYDFIDFLSARSLVPSAASLRLSEHAGAQGQLTGILMRASDGETVCEALYYDMRGNVTRNISIGLDGVVSVTASEYDFAGRPVSARFTTGSGLKACDVVTSGTYDAASGVPVSCGVSIKTGGIIRAAAGRELGYDGTGRISTVTRGGNAGTVSRTRNIRGWTSGISGPGFSQDLSYTEVSGRELYSSLVSRQTWSEGSGATHIYTYSYDDLGRLTGADYMQPSFLTPASASIPMPVARPANYGEHVTGYTPNGSVTGIRRWGAVMSPARYGLVDDMTLEYEGNRLVRVSDDAPEINVIGAMDFTDGADLDVEYRYNGEGALLSDANKGISRIDYDDSGYPRLVQFAGGSQTHYVYTPSGQKLRERHLSAVAGITVPLLQKIELAASMILAADSTDYVGPLVIHDGKPDIYLDEGGCFKAAETGREWTACYCTYDHLGNVRAVVDSEGSILQTLHYYPFGAVITDLCKGYTVQPYQFGGKEIDRMHGLNWNDFGARRYDPALAMWTSPDPLQSDYTSFSPYLYCMANPVNFTDPTGMYVVMLGNTSKERQDLEGRVLKETKEPLFGAIYNLMVQSNKAFYYQYGEVKPPNNEGNSSDKTHNGSFNPSTNTITISSAPLDETTFSLTCAEESYHAIQSSMPDIGTNIEYEAHTFALLHNLNKGSLFIPKDFENTDYSDFDKYYESDGDNLRFNKVYFKNDFYIRNGETFVNYYKSSGNSDYTTPVKEMPFRLYVLVWLLY